MELITEGNFYKNGQLNRTQKVYSFKKGNFEISKYEINGIIDNYVISNENKSTGMGLDPNELHELRDFLNLIDD
jgi:hypothetical protein